MRNLILGIILILCLQISFQVYLAVERTREDYRALVPVSSVAGEDREVASLSESTPIDDITVGDSRLLRSSRNSTSTARIRHRTPEFRAPMVAFKRPKPKTIDVETIDTVAVKTRYVDQTSSLRAKPATNALAADRVEKREKRSFFAKALPVLKKPYDWLKAVGSKLK